MNFLDRNEFNFQPSEKVVKAIKDFDPRLYASTLAYMMKARKAL